MNLVTNAFQTISPRTEETERSEPSTTCFLSRSVSWLRGEGLDEKDKMFRKVAAIAVAVLLNLTVIGIVGVILGTIEWLKQEQNSFKLQARIAVKKTNGELEIQQGKEEVLRKANKELTAQKEELEASQKKLNKQLEAQKATEKKLIAIVKKKEQKYHKILKINAQKNPKKHAKLPSFVEAFKMASITQTAKKTDEQVTKSLSEEKSAKQDIPPNWMASLHKLDEWCASNPAKQKESVESFNKSNLTMAAKKNDEFASKKTDEENTTKDTDDKMTSFLKQNPSHQILAQKIADGDALTIHASLMNNWKAIHMISSLQILASMGYIPSTLHDLPLTKKQPLEDPFYLITNDDIQNSDEKDAVKDEKVSVVNEMIAPQNAGKEVANTTVNPKSKDKIKADMEAMLAGIQSLNLAVKNKLEVKKAI